MSREPGESADGGHVEGPLDADGGPEGLEEAGLLGNSPRRGTRDRAASSRPRRRSFRALCTAAARDPRVWAMLLLLPIPLTVLLSEASLALFIIFLLAFLLILARLGALAQMVAQSMPHRYSSGRLPRRAMAYHLPGHAARFGAPRAVHIPREHLRLIMTDRNFTAEDYDRLLQLDENNEPRRAAQATETQIRRLPTFRYKAPSSNPGGGTTGDAPAPEGGEQERAAADSTGGDGPAKAEEVDQDRYRCAVCLCEYEEGEELKILPCLHRFHAECVDTWLRNSATCPVCKYSAVDYAG